ncbi:hypothetical protein ACLOJK_028860 [Asimina triloba]
MVRGEAEVRWSGEASSSLAGAGSPAEGLAHEEGRLRKKRCLKKDIREGQGPVMPQDEEEESWQGGKRPTSTLYWLCLARRLVARASLFLLRSLPIQGQRSLPMEPVDSMPTESVHVVDVEGDFASPVSVSGKVPFVQT